jgi:hypothetical protein
VAAGTEASKPRSLVASEAEAEQKAFEFQVSSRTAKQPNVDIRLGFPLADWFKAVASGLLKRPGGVA